MPSQDEATGRPSSVTNRAELLESHLATIVPRTLEGIAREYPNGVVIGVSSSGQWREPGARHPIFFGCYDWHSAVHSHWQLIRLLRCFGGHEAVTSIEPALDSRFTPPKVATELATLHRWPGWEAPYGMAWLLQLGSELVEWDDPAARRWLEAIQPLIEEAELRITGYVGALTRPVRTGTHGQSAFSLGLAHDWSRTAGNAGLGDLIAEKALALFGGDRDAPLEYEPSATDFLSPALAEADLMRRILPTAEFVEWLDRFLPVDDDRLTGRLRPEPVVDPSNGQLAHIAGLNMSRSWMAAGVASALPPGHRLRDEFGAVAERHLEEGFEVALHPDYMVSHWAPTFVVYLCTERGIRGSLTE
jgi:hypothetical protein